MNKKPVRVRRSKPKPVELEGRHKSQWMKLKGEYDSLRQERTKLRQEITQLDSRLAKGALTEMERDREFKQRLCKAGDISRRLIQVVSEMAKLGRVPEEYKE